MAIPEEQVKDIVLQAAEEEQEEDAASKAVIVAGEHYAGQNSISAVADVKVASGKRKAAANLQKEACSMGGEPERLCRMRRNSLS